MGCPLVVTMDGGEVVSVTGNTCKRGEHAFSARSRKSECDGQPYSFAYPLPAYGAAIFKFN